MKLTKPEHNGASQLIPGVRRTWEGRAGGPRVHEEGKLGEAAHFLEGMKRAQDQHDALSFGYELSAFASAARGVLQYAYEEAKAKGRLAWYENAVRDYPRISFFRTMRNLNIHSRPVAPKRSTSVEVHAPLIMADAVALAPHDPAGNTAPQQQLTPTVGAAPSNGWVETTTRFFLTDWTGPEDAVALAEQYMADLHAVVVDGRANGALTA
jgi:hypothetical protein